MRFETRRISDAADAIAPDGSQVRVLCGLSRGSLAVFSLPPGAVAKAVVHRSVEEVWFVLAGTGQIWRQLGAQQEITDLRPGVSIAIPTGMAFQFRCDGAETLSVLGATMPPWPGDAEAVPVDGAWQPTISRA